MTIRRRTQMRAVAMGLLIQERANMPLVRQGLLLIVLGLSLLVVPLAAAQSAVDQSSIDQSSIDQSSFELPAPAASDTVHTNLWLTEALMGEIVTTAMGAMPPAPAAVRLQPMRDDPRNDLFQAVAAEILGAAGYDLFVPEEDPARQGAVDYVFGYVVQDIGLSYPDVGRTLGLWRSWVAREITVSVMLKISAEDSGRLLLNERIVRRFGDRFDSDYFDGVDSEEYKFTTAETSESGWKGRMEEIVVLGTLVGLVAIYFANTGD